MDQRPAPEALEDPARFATIKGSDAIDVERLEHLAVLNRNVIKIQFESVSHESIARGEQPGGPGPRSPPPA